MVRLAWMLPLLAGCDVLLPLQGAPVVEQPDAAATRDAALDGSGRDRAVDGLPAEAAAGEGAVADLPRVDLTRDLGSPDQPGSTTAACADNKTPVLVYGPTMTMCEGPTQVTQCAAAQYCNGPGGWSICSASQYRARGGTTTPSSATHPGAWIKGCIRAGGAPFAPLDATCLCTAGSATNVAVEWDCSDGSEYKIAVAHVGLRTSSSCRWVGVQTAATKAYWSGFAASGMGDRVVCCK